MLAGFVALLLKFATSGILDRTLRALEAGQANATEGKRLDATVAIEQVRGEIARRNAQAAVVLAEQGRAATALMRPAFAYPLAVYYAAVITDSLLHFKWNVSALPAPIGDWSGWIISAIFLSESGERITRIIARRRGT